MNSTTLTETEILAIIGNDEYVMPNTEFYDSYGGRRSKAMVAGYFNMYGAAIHRNKLRAEMRARLTAGIEA